MKIIVEKDTSDKIYTDLGLLETSCDKEQFHIGMNVELEHGKVNEFTNVTNDDLLTTGKIISIAATTSAHHQVAKKCFEKIFTCLLKNQLQLQLMKAKS